MAPVFRERKRESRGGGGGRGRETGREIDGQAGRQTDRKRESDRHTQRDREVDRQQKRDRQTDRDRQADVLKIGLCVRLTVCLLSCLPGKPVCMLADQSLCSLSLYLSTFLPVYHSLSPPASRSACVHVTADKIKQHNLNSKLSSFNREE